MARPRQRNKTRKVSRKEKNRWNIPMNKLHPLMKENWDKKKTLMENYENMGLISFLGGRAGGQQKQGEDFESSLKTEIEYKSIENVPVETVEPETFVDKRCLLLGTKVNEKNPIISKKPKTDIVQAFEKEATMYAPVIQHSSEQECLVLENLLAKYGDDFEAMARDRKLNPYQLSAGQLKRKFRKPLA